MPEGGGRRVARARSRREVGAAQVGPWALSGPLQQPRERGRAV